MVILFLVFKGTSILFSIVAVSIYILTNIGRVGRRHKREGIWGYMYTYS